jgi:hypothetical protein
MHDISDIEVYVCTHFKFRSSSKDRELVQFSYVYCDCVCGFEIKQNYHTCDGEGLLPK